jgi:hypothetical protein
VKWPTAEEIRVLEILERLPASVTERFMDWKVQELQAMWPLLRDELVKQGVDVEAAEQGDDPGP